MNLPDRKKTPLAPWRPAAVVQEVLSHAALVALAWFGGLGYFGVIAVWVTEMVVGNLLTWVMYPERGFWRHLRDLLMFVCVVAFLLLFVVVTYGVGMGTVQDDSPTDLALATVRNTDPDVLLWSVGFAVVHLTVMLLWARSQPDPKREWARTVLLQSAATFVALFCLIFVIAFAAETIISIVGLVVEVPKDAVLAFLAVAVRFGFALLISRMPDKDLNDIARQPYNT